MKKILAFVLAVACTLSLAGCGGFIEASEPTEDEAKALKDARAMVENELDLKASSINMYAYDDDSWRVGNWDIDEFYAPARNFEGGFLTYTEQFGEPYMRLKQSYTWDEFFNDRQLDVSEQSLCYADLTKALNLDHGDMCSALVNMKLSPGKVHAVFGDPIFSAKDFYNNDVDYYYIDSYEPTDSPLPGWAKAAGDDNVIAALVSQTDGVDSTGRGWFIVTYDSDGHVSTVSATVRYYLCDTCALFDACGVAYAVGDDGYLAWTDSGDYDGQVHTDHSGENYAMLWDGTIVCERMLSRGSNGAEWYFVDLTNTVGQVKIEFTALDKQKNDIGKRTIYWGDGTTVGDILNANGLETNEFNKGFGADFVWEKADVDVPDGDVDPSVSVTAYAKGFSFHAISQSLTYLSGYAAKPDVLVNGVSAYDIDAMVSVLGKPHSVGGSWNMVSADYFDASQGYPQIYEWWLGDDWGFLEVDVVNQTVFIGHPAE